METDVHTAMSQGVTLAAGRPELGTAAWREGHRLYLAWKRLLDVVVAGILSLVLSPLMAVIAVLIRVDSPGPAIFRQERVGLKRCRQGVRVVHEVGTFEMYKFRTMYHGSDSDVHRHYVEAFIRNDERGMAAFQGEETKLRKVVNDARVTPVGRFLRKSSLDELPQLWNVIKGDMSLVGPRPPIPYEVEMYLDWHHKRLAAQPGLTGLWQVTARSSADFDEMVRLDVYYIEHPSFWLDLKILLKTPIVVLSGNGAE